MGGGGGNYWALIGAGITAAGDRMGGWGPKPDEFIGRRAQRTSKWPYKDLKALRKGGINDPSLDYLGPDERTEAKLRDETQGVATAGEQRLGDAMRGYGGPSNKSGMYMEGIGRMRAGRTMALAGAMRDLQIQKWANFHAMQGAYKSAHEQFQGDDQFAYEKAMKYWQTKKDHYAMAGKALGDAVTAYGQGQSGAGAPQQGGGGGGGISGGGGNSMAYGTSSGGFGY